MRSYLVTLVAALVLAGAGVAHATVVLEFANAVPVETRGEDWDWAGFLGFEVDGIGVGIHSSGPGFETVEWDATFNLFVTEDHLACANGTCAPFVATFSAALDAVTVDFTEAEWHSGSGEEVLISNGFYLQAYAGENGTGVLLGSALIPEVPAALIVPGSLSIVAPAIRSIVFGSESLYEGEYDRVNVAWVARIDMTPVPEPGAAALMILGLIGLGARARMRGGL